MADWFLGEQKIQKVQVVPYSEMWKCPELACDGSMMFTGMTWPTSAPGYHHKCNKCGVVWVTHHGTFPRISFEEAKVDA